MKKILVLLATVVFMFGCSDDSPTNSNDSSNSGTNSSSSDISTGTSGTSGTSSGGTSSGESSSGETEPVKTIGVINMTVNVEGSCAGGGYPIIGKIKTNASVTDISFAILDSNDTGVSSTNAAMILEDWYKYTVRGLDLTNIVVDGSPLVTDAYSACVKLEADDLCIGNYSIVTTVNSASENYADTSSFRVIDGLSDEERDGCPSWR